MTVLREIHGPAGRLEVLIEGRRPFALAVGLVVPSASHAQDAGGFPPKVRAVYRISWNGVDLGKFQFSSDLKGGQYTLNGDARLEAFFGAFHWRGITRSLGTIAGAGPSPASYAFSFDGNDKRGSVNLNFEGGAVSRVVAVPASGPSPGRVPVTRAHLQGVLDPLSAIMAITASKGKRVDGTNPCSRRIPIFDGKQRFDLAFSFKRTAPLSEIGAKSAHNAFVCRVKYIPIAGYRMNEDMRQMQQASGIEVWMVPLAEANLFIPYYVLVPLSAGTATLTADRVNIDTARGRIALQ